MAKDVYNLQVPIDINLADTLKHLADEDDRTLRAYCKRILQNHVKNLGKEISKTTTIVEQVKEDTTIVPEVKDVAEVTQETEKKPKVGGFRK